MSFTDFRYKLAVFIAPSLEDEVYARALKLAPKVMLQEYQCKFFGSDDYPDGALSNSDKNEFMLWAKQNIVNPWFKYFVRTRMDIQGNWALRNAANDRQADFARATLNSFELMYEEVERLASLFDKEQKDKAGVNEYDPFSTGISDI